MWAQWLRGVGWQSVLLLLRCCGQGEGRVLPVRRKQGPRAVPSRCGALLRRLFGLCCLWTYSFLCLSLVLGEEGGWRRSSIGRRHALASSMCHTRAGIGSFCLCRCRLGSDCTVLASCLVTACLCWCLCLLSAVELGPGERSLSFATLWCLLLLVVFGILLAFAFSRCHAEEECFLLPDDV